MPILTATENGRMFGEVKVTIIRDGESKIVVTITAEQAREFGVELIESAALAAADV